MTAWTLRRTIDRSRFDLCLDLPGLQRAKRRADADGRLPVLLGVSVVQDGGAPETGGLLCLLFLWHCALPPDSGRQRVLRMTFVDLLNRLLRSVPPWALYLVLAVPAPWYLYQGATGGLGVEPIKALEHALGEFALQLAIVGLAVTPLRRVAGVNLLKFRRAIGIMTFTYVFLHLLVWLVLDVQILSQIWADILKRPYITVGMAGFVLMIPLVATSNNWSVRRLGPRWRKLHRLTYPAVALGGLHYVMLAKGFQIEPLIYLGVILGLLALRVRTLPRFRTA